MIITVLHNNTDDDEDDDDDDNDDDATVNNEHAVAARTFPLYKSSSLSSTADDKNSDDFTNDDKDMITEVLNNKQQNAELAQPQTSPVLMTWGILSTAARSRTDRKLSTAHARI